jgi:hypothetical protein
MKSLAVALCLIVPLACGQAQSDSVVYVRVSPPVGTTPVTRLHVKFSNAGSSGSEFFPSGTSTAPISFTPAASFVLVLPRRRTGGVEIAVDALDATSTTVARGVGSGAISVGRRTDVAIALERLLLPEGAIDGGVDAVVSDAPGPTDTRIDLRLLAGTGGVGEVSSPQSTGGIQDAGRTPVDAYAASGGISGSGGITAGSGGIASTGGSGGAGGAATRPTSGGSTGSSSGLAKCAPTTAKATAITSTGGMACPAGLCTVGVYAGHIYVYSDGEKSGPSAICAAPESLCASGTTGAADAKGTIWGAGVGFNLDKSATPTAVQLAGTGMTYALSAMPAQGMRAQVSVAGTDYCVKLATVSGTVAWTDFNTACWDNTGTKLTGPPSTPHIGFQVTAATAAGAFDFCVTKVSF